MRISRGDKAGQYIPRTKTTPNRLALGRLVSAGTKNQDACIAYQNHNIAELVSASRDISQASSKLRGNNIKAKTPWSANTANRAPELLGRTRRECEM